MGMHKNHCLVCNEELEYSTEAKELKCVYCGRSFEATASCKHGHYVCDECHSADAFSLIETFCRESDLHSPVEIAEQLFKHPAVKMHGPEHHYLVPAVMLTAYYNYRNESSKKANVLKEARKRAKQVAGGSCGFHGTCGAAVGIGMFVSLLLKATPVSKEEWKTANRATAECLLRIADHGGPRCCKRDSVIAIQYATEWLVKLFDIHLPAENFDCSYSRLNNECLFSDCPFFGNQYKN